MRIAEVRCENYKLTLPLTFHAGENPSGKEGVLGMTQSGWKWQSAASESELKEALFSIIRVTTDSGEEGHHFAAAMAFSPRVIPQREVEALRRCLIGRDPHDRELIWQDMWAKVGYDSGGLRSLAAFDCALWDLAGKLVDLPVHKLLGGYRTKVPVYACSWHLDSPGAYFRDVAAAKAAGIKAYKLHVRADIAIEACRAAREAGGPEMVLMLDGGTGYRYADALKVGRELEKLGFYWLEEPVRDYETYSLRKLREKLDIPICAGEKVKWSMYDAATWIKNDYADFIRTDTDRAGGITPCKRIADMCHAFGIQCEIHYGGVANLQVQGAISNCRYYELMWPEPRYGLTAYPEIVDGYIEVPSSPGLGATIDWEALGPCVESY